ncbi:hypothetical protein HK098_003162 [Nowakowskiella sp. JEL0407]|nr:hypothetical protein HK098_003162 [Nowakowskiella sp. JEL0407]
MVSVFAHLFVRSPAFDIPVLLDDVKIDTFGNFNVETSQTPVTTEPDLGAQMVEIANTGTDNDETQVQLVGSDEAAENPPSNLATCAATVQK